MSERSDHPGSRGEDAVLLAAGLVDLAVSRVSPVVDRVCGVLRRSDLAAMADDAQSDLKARGRLAMDRYAAVPPAHMEVLAQRVVARRAAAGDV